MSEFRVGEIIECLSEGSYYKAKIIEKNDSGPQFFVHYYGWSSGHDEWVQTDKLRHLEPEESRRMSVSERKRRRSSAIESGTVPSEDVTRAEILFEIPTGLKKRVVYEWEQIVHRNIVDGIQLSAHKKNTKSVHAIVNKEYLKDKNAEISQTDELVMEACLGYFDEAFSALLLYDAERSLFDQLAENKSPNKRYCELVGMNFMLRLFVKLPTLVVHTRMNVEAAAMWRASMEKFARWLDDRPDEWWAR
eukprot:ANDGO_02330.mRNA.1 Chromatin modification-related protein eaf3